MLIYSCTHFAMPYTGVPAYMCVQLYLPVGIVQFRVDILLGGSEGPSTRRKHQSSVNTDIVETVSCSWFTVYTGSKLPLA